MRAVVARSVPVLIEVAPDLVGLFVPGAKLVGALGTAVAVRVGWMDQLDDLAQQQAQEAGAGTPVIDQTRIFEQYTSLLKRLSNETPLVLFVDDLQWADRASIGLLFHLGRNLQAHRILLLGAFRPNDLVVGRNEERHPLEPAVNELTRYYGDVTVDLDSIPEDDSRRFVEAYLDTEPNCLEAAFRDALYHHTGGHALFTVELLNSLKDAAT